MSKGAARAVATRNANRGAASYVMKQDREKDNAQGTETVQGLLAASHKNEVLPHMKAWVHCGNMSKKIISNQGVKLQTRFAVLTEENLYFTHLYDLAHPPNTATSVKSSAAGQAEIESVWREYVNAQG